MQYASKLIKDLCAIGERQLAGEKKARKIIERFLKQHKIDYAVEEYDTYIPKYGRFGLTIDGKKVDCEPCGYISGKIESNYTVLSSLISSQKNIYDANINFNPACGQISRSNHYFAPALAINRKDVQKVVTAKQIDGFMTVKKTEHRSANILVGNIENPKYIVFSHYDSVSVGAVDNASGTALSLEYIVEHPEALAFTLFALCGNEELSYDAPLYWGHGYRVFEDNHGAMLENVEKILVLDSFGHSAPQKITSLDIVTLGFPIKSIGKYLPRVTMIAGSLEGLMTFYHAKNDLPKNVSPNFYAQTKEMFSTELSS